MSYELHKKNYQLQIYLNNFPLLSVLSYVSSLFARIIIWLVILNDKVELVNLGMLDYNFVH